MSYFVEYASEPARADGAGQSTYTASAAPAARLHVLVAEDNPVNQLLVQTLLKIAGHSSMVVSNGAAAVRAVQEHSFDLVLMDIRMPEMSGIDASRAIRALGGAYASLPIIAMTANSEPEDVDSYTAAGMTGFVPKPLDRQEFLAMLEFNCRQKVLSCA